MAKLQASKDAKAAKTEIKDKGDAKPEDIKQQKPAENKPAQRSATIEESKAPDVKLAEEKQVQRSATTEESKAPETKPAEEKKPK